MRTQESRSTWSVSPASGRTGNVRRLKDALMKKEILTFEGQDERPVILDPLFEYWLKNHYFNTNP